MRCVYLITVQILIFVKLILLYKEKHHLRFSTEGVTLIVLI